MKLILLPRGYEVDGSICFTWAGAQLCAQQQSMHLGRPINVQRDPLVKDGEQIEGEQTVARFVKGVRVFPIL